LEVDYLESIVTAIDEGETEQVAELTQKALDEGIPAKELMERGLVRGMEKVGEKFKEGVAYLPEILIAARAANRGLEVLKPAITKSGVKPKGKVVIGTIEGDLHDIGKNMVKFVLQGNGFEVIDLGVDVSAAQFHQAVVEEKPDMVAISALLTTTMVNIPSVLETLGKTGLRGGVKIMVGGASLTEEYAQEVGVDAYGEDCFQAVEIARRFMGVTS